MMKKLNMMILGLLLIPTLSFATSMSSSFYSGDPIAGWVQPAQGMGGVSARQGDNIKAVKPLDIAKARYANGEISLAALKEIQQNLNP